MCFEFQQQNLISKKLTCEKMDLFNKFEQEVMTFLEETNGNGEIIFKAFLIMMLILMFIFMGL